MFDLFANNICDVITTPKRQAEKFMSKLKQEIKDLGVCPCETCSAGIEDCKECNKEATVPNNCAGINTCGHCDCSDYNSGYYMKERYSQIKKLAKDYYIVYLQHIIFDLREQLASKGK